MTSISNLIQANMTDLNVLSLNVKGMRNGSKRRELFRWLKRYYNAESKFVFIQESHSLPTDVNIWQHEWGSNIVFSHGTNDARGVAILVPSHISSSNIEKSWADDDGRIVMIKIKCEGESYALINVYAPTKNHQKLQLNFLNTLKQLIRDNEDSMLILGGDFNTYLNPVLDKDSENNEAVTKYGKEILSLLEEQQLIDIWRILNPTSKRFTWRQKNPFRQTRLDYFFISLNLQFQVQKCEIKPSIKTDHSLLSLNITLNEPIKRGPGFWKFNTALLKDEVYIDYIKEIILDLKVQTLNIDDKGLRWDYIKSEIRQRTITYSKVQAQLAREYEDNLLDNYNHLSERFEQSKDKTIENQLEIIKQEIEHINKEKTNGAIIRSKATWLRENQRDTSHFANLEKKNYRNGHITKLNGDNNHVLTTPKDILEESKKFYEKLYTHDDSNSDDFDDFFLKKSTIPKLDDLESASCNQPICLDECSKTLLKMKNGKTPGSDGLSVEFYKMFWSTIKDLVFESINYAMHSGHLSIDQKRGIIKLIPKKDKDITYLKNWRPISLLNTDYKLISHILANRMQQIISKIVHTDQNGYIKGRFIGCNIRTILDMIEVSQNKYNANLITFVDYEKAFDNIEWKFMEKCLIAFGFGNNFISFIKTLYKDINSCIINNGFTSAYFKITRGVRQGCPLSALLFVLVVEILAIEIRHNDNVKGIVLNGKSIKLCLLADDTTLFLSDIQSLQTILNLMYMFKQSSGLKINYEKTQVLQIGQQEWNVKHFKLKNIKDRIYSLGTWFYKDPKITVLQNQAFKLEEFNKILQQWQYRDLTLHGRIMVVKSLALSKMHFMISSFQISDDFVNQCQNIINNFIWKNKPPKIKHSVSMHALEDGGIKIPHFETIVKASKAAWAKRMLNYNDNWIQYLQTFLPSMKINQLLKCFIDPNDLAYNIPEFYRQVLHAWFALHKEPLNASDVRREVIFFNKHIQIDNLYIIRQPMIDNNIILIHHLTDNIGNFFFITQ